LRLRKISGKTYAIEYPSAVGIFLIDDKSCILIDSGASSVYARRTLQIVEKMGVQVTGIINTHAHADHSGGNKYIQDAADCRIFASPIEAAYLNNPIMAAYVQSNSVPLNSIRNKFFSIPEGTVNSIIDEAVLNIQGVDFIIWDLPGHTLGHVGVETPDNVLFTGDSIIDPKILIKHPVLHLDDVSMQIKTLQMLKNKRPGFVYLSHGGMVDNIEQVIDKNYEQLMNNLEVIGGIIEKACTREEVISKLAEIYGFQLKENSYFRLHATTAAYLAYLHNTGRVSVFMQEGRLLYSRQE